MEICTKKHRLSGDFIISIIRQGFFAESLKEKKARRSVLRPDVPNALVVYHLRRVRFKAAIGEKGTQKES